MSRPLLSPAAAGLMRALAFRLGRQSQRMRLTDCRSVDWQSLTFTGQRHRIDLIIAGPDGERWAQRLVEGLEEAELNLPGRFVADITIASPILPRPDGSAELAIEALTIQD